MVITISANLSPEEVQIISSIKGYSPTIAINVWEPDIENPQSREDFVRQVYEAMVKNDAKGVFLEYIRVQRQEADRLEDEAISKNIDNAISSSVE